MPMSPYYSMIQRYGFSISHDGAVVAEGEVPLFDYALTRNSDGEVVYASNDRDKIVAFIEGYHYAQRINELDVTGLTPDERAKLEWA